jgi:hypothetical protein
VLASSRPPVPADTNDQRRARPGGAARAPPAAAPPRRGPAPPPPGGPRQGIGRGEALRHPANLHGALSRLRAQGASGAQGLDGYDNGPQRSVLGRDLVAVSAGEAGGEGRAEEGAGGERPRP